MNTSSFLRGVLVGAAASALLSRNKQPMLSGMGQAGQKMMNMIMPGLTNMMNNPMNSHPQAGSGTHQAAAHTNNSTTHHSTREADIQMIKDFINSDPSVKNEVEQIMKETNTSIPGL
ncbi:hypothetical protein PASE110613_01540 [Paenibacillus sediminis]|uniref:Archaellum component FlaG (FlaF/FlaG flagellin family) n=1 Tax=Paenibacillus sediminis TaxID=664909 RepID=A0ABS4GZN1_9BACL|nr:hypothetical protein [Paenibacillus sediminis]MBP1935733.1 archaellum component FlaG (FlaF/FlaG flagellin family) [Paenibacillus sediminis]